MLCLDSCNLGCSSIGCTLTELAQNQPIILVFSQDLDPNSVNSANFSLKAPNGEEPVGTYLVNRNIATFVPEIRVSGSQSFFGFKANETYVMTLHGGADNPNSIRSTSGDRLSRTIVCNLLVSRGIVDLDGSPPAFSVLTPAATSNVSRSTPIVLESTEILDQTAFLSADPGNQPVKVRLRRTQQGPNGTECNPQSAATPISGTWQITNNPGLQRSTIKFNNPIELPGNICVEIEVTNLVKDLAGTSATPQLFQFTTEPASLSPRTLAEDFQNNLQLDRDSSSGTWQNGEARAGEIGGSGEHGDFSTTYLRLISPDVYEINTDSQAIPRTFRTPPSDDPVLNGTFYFSSFVLPRGVTVIAAGSKPLRIYCRGKMEIQGVIDVSARDMAEHTDSPFGQVAGNGGPSGARGGKGSNRGDGANPGFNGNDGENVNLPAGHAYESRRAGTGGKGSVQFPLSGRNADVTWGYFNFYSTQISAGGGGAGGSTAGTVGRAVQTYANRTQDLGPDAPAGGLFDAFPIPAATSTLDHMLIGGAGGGGSGSHPFFSLELPRTYNWRSGSAGAGGGGAFGARVGGDLTVGSIGRLLARGGSGFPSGNATIFPGAGGGGGGGSVILQVAGSVNQTGLIDVRGGAGGYNRAGVYSMDQTAGNGAPGFLRLEVTGATSVGLLGQTQPAATANNVATLREIDYDTIAGQRSKWYSTRQVFPPEYVRYEVDAVIGSTPVKFSDDPAFGVLATDGQPVRFWVQAANLDSFGLPIPNSIQPWRRYVGPFGGAGNNINDDARTAVRFILLSDRATTRDVVVKKVSIFYRA